MLSLGYNVYPGLGNGSISYRRSSVGNTPTFDVVEDTGSNPTSDVFFSKRLRVRPKKRVSLGPQVLERGGYVHVLPYADGIATSQISRRSEGERNVKRTTLGCVIERCFTPTAQ